MKKLLVFLLAVVMSILAASCGEPREEKSLYEIVIVPRAWSQELSREIDAYVEDRPALNVYQNMSEEEDDRYQALLVEDLIAQEVDAICLDPVREETILPVLEQAREAGIVVVTGSDFCQMIDQAEQMLRET